MAGYMSKLQGYVYEGEYKNRTAAAVTPGTLFILGTVSVGTETEIGFIRGAVDTVSQFICKEVGEIYQDVKAARYQVIKLAQNYYFHEQTEIPYREVVFDMTSQEFAVGAYLRCHPLVEGEEFWSSYDPTGTAPVVNTIYGVKADGTIG